MIYGDRVRQARELCELTQEELAIRVNVNQSTIARVENDSLCPSTELLRTIGRQTGFLPSFFEQEPIKDFSEGSLIYRSRLLPSQEESRTYQYAKIIYEQAKKMAMACSLPPHRLPTTDMENPANAARIVRTSFGLSPDTPIKNLTRVVEGNGIILLTLPLASAKLDAFSTWAELDCQRPIIAALLDKPIDRLHFTYGHEIGHLVLHRPIKGSLKELDKEANQFAAEFLLPESAMIRELLPPVTLTSVARLKPRWGVSMQALINRARGLGIITERQFRYLFQQLSAHGWRKHEPPNLDLPPERPQAVRRMAETLYKDIDEFALDMHIEKNLAMKLLLVAKSSST
jgi:Zn-dependent peptidase ImmA (M78 family)/DNA-binding XRE family transcriptional regulator